MTVPNLGLVFYWKRFPLIYVRKRKMFSNSAIGWSSLGYFAAVLAYMAVLRLLEKRFYRRQRFTDDEYLNKMASIGDCSVYDMFFVCAEKWNVSKLQIEDDFRKYLLRNEIPYYVREFARTHKKDLDRYNPQGFRFYG